MIKINLKIVSLILIGSIILTGCARWENAIGVQKIKSQKISFDLKNSKWHAFNNESSEIYNLTKDGLLLQNININRTNLEDALSFSKKNINENMLQHELADIVIENLKLNARYKSLKVISNEPELIANQNGVNIIFQTKDEYKNIIKTNATYFIFDKKLYNLSYIAPLQYFYEKDLNEYISIKKSIILDL